MVKRLLVGLLMVLAAFLMLVVADALFGWLVPVPLSFFEKHKRAAVAYQQEPYFSHEFVAESLREPEGWTTPPGTILVFPNEFHGKWFNVDTLPPTGLRYRRTVNPPATEKPVKKVLFMGGSSVWGAEVPDDLTIPSLLAKLLNERSSEFRYEVLNAGVTSVNSRQEVARLQHEFEKGLKPDLVLTLDGGNEVTLGVYYGFSEGTVFGPTAVKARQALNLMPHHIFNWSRRRAEVKSIENGERISPAAMKPQEKRDANRRRTVEEYAANLKAMNKLCQQHGARFVAFLQPSLYTSDVNPNDPDVKQARELSERAWPELDVAYRETMPDLQRVVQELRGQGLAVYDLTGVFSGKKEPLFLDFGHVNSKGNLILAEQIAERIR